jgi:hypothetical protein
MSIHIGLLAFAFPACWPLEWAAQLLGSIFIFTGVQHGESTRGIADSTKVIGSADPDALL